MTVNGGWSNFGDWGECSVTCGSGVQARSRSCTNPPPAYGGAGCTGTDKQTRECAAGICKGWYIWVSGFLNDGSVGRDGIDSAKASSRCLLQNF